jgi:hypothetical protein
VYLVNNEVDEVYVYTCIHCRCTWTDTEEDKLRLLAGASSNKNNKSGGICPECYRNDLKENIQRHQFKNYGHSCFLSNGNCAHTVCCFHYVCNDSSFENWKKTKL